MICMDISRSCGCRQRNSWWPFQYRFYLGAPKALSLEHLLAWLRQFWLVFEDEFWLKANRHNCYIRSMKNNFKRNMLVLATVTVGLSAGLLFGYQVSVIPGFRTLSDREYIAAFQAINVAIQNPIFFLCYLGAVVFAFWTVFLHRGTAASGRFKLLCAAAALYLVTIVITMGANVPLNNKLAAFPLESSTPAQQAAFRADFEGPWNSWHLVRTLTSIGSLALFVVVCMSPADDQRGLKPKKDNG